MCRVCWCVIRITLFCIDSSWLTVSWINYAPRQPNNIPVLDGQLQYKNASGNGWEIQNALFNKKLCQCRETVRAHRHLKLCKMLHKCSTDCIWKGMQSMNDLQGHSRSLPLLPFDRPYTISYQSSIVSVCQSCTVFDILTLICQKLRRHVTLTTPIWEQCVIITRLTLLASTRAQNLRLYLSLKGYVSRQYLWTVRQGNGWTTTLLLEVFTQRNFVADFIRLKLNFIFLNRKSIFEPPFVGLMGNVRIPFMARWKARSRLPIRHNLTFFAISYG